MGLKFQARKAELQTDLNVKRELLEKLVDRMHDLGQVRTQSELEIKAPG